MDVGSISKVKVILEISGKGVSQGHIVRHLSPLTSLAILKSLPIQRRANKFKDRFVYIETELALGREKQRRSGALRPRPGILISFHARPKQPR